MPGWLDGPLQTEWVTVSGYAYMHVQACVGECVECVHVCENAREIERESACV